MTILGILGIMCWLLIFKYDKGSNVPYSIRGGGGGGSAPEYRERPEVTESIRWLIDWGKKLFAGEAPEYLKPIGEPFPAGAQYAMKRGTQFLKEQASKTGALGSSALVSKIADLAKQVQMEDWYRAMTGRQWLGGMGTEMVGKGGGMGQRREETQYAGALKAYEMEQAQPSWLQSLGTIAGYGSSMFLPGGTLFGTQFGTIPSTYKYGSAKWTPGAGAGGMW